jgi:hypothetical protein
VVHACNPSHLGGRDQEGGVRSHPGQIVPETLSRKNPSQKRVSGVAQGVGRESKPKYWRGKKKKKKVGCRLGPLQILTVGTSH